VLAGARRVGAPVRGHSEVRHLAKFYGQWGGETHLEQISAASLARMLETEIGEGVTELMCHPGYTDRDYTTSYSVEREAELRTLCDPGIGQALAQASIELISYYELASVMESARV